MTEMNPVQQAIDDLAASYRAAGHLDPLHLLVSRKGVYGRGLPFTGERMPARACFENALTYAEINDLLYVEGYGLAGTLLERDLVLPVHHAWCMDRKGNVIDPTWKRPEDCHYLGIAFELQAAVERILGKGSYSVFEDHIGRLDLDFLDTLAPGFRQECERLREEIASEHEANLTPRY